jgi:hypothetical protein
VAVREFALQTGVADYLLFVDHKAIGAVEAKGVVPEERVEHAEPVARHRGTRVTWGARGPARSRERCGVLQAAEERACTMQIRSTPTHDTNGARGLDGPVVMVWA